MVGLTVSYVWKSKTESENYTNTFILPSLTPISASLASFPCLISVQTVSTFTCLFVFLAHCTLPCLHSLHKSSSGTCAYGWIAECRFNIFGLLLSPFIMRGGGGFSILTKQAPLDLEICFFLWSRWGSLYFSGCFLFAASYTCSDPHKHCMAQQGMC